MKVVIEVEVGVVHQDRMIDSQRNDPQPASKRRNSMQPRRDEPAEEIEGEAVGGGGWVDQHDPGDMHVDHRVFHIEK
jgi:hypothetical protein